MNKVLIPTVPTDGHQSDEVPHDQTLEGQKLDDDEIRPHVIPQQRQVHFTTDSGADRVDEFLKAEDEDRDYGGEVEDEERFDDSASQLPQHPLPYRSRIVIDSEPLLTAAGRVAPEAVYVSVGCDVWGC